MGTETRSYDDLDNLTGFSRTYTGLAARSLSYTYYPDGSRQTMTAGSGTWTYSYNARGECTSLASPAGTSSNTYWDNGWMGTRTLPNGAKTTYDYFDAGFLKSLLNEKADGTDLSKFDGLEYDGAFNLKKVVSTFPGMSVVTGQTTWTHNSKDQLTNETSTRVGGWNHSFAYDPAGNPTTLRGASKTFNDDNQMTGSGFVYDGNGNPTTYAGVAVAYDRSDQATRFGPSSSPILVAGYMASGLRAYKEVDAERTYSLYDGLYPVEEFDASGTVTAINVYAPDGLVARKEFGSWTYLMFDQQGSAVLLLDSSRSVTVTRACDAYGRGVEWDDPAVFDPFGYCAQWGYLLDRETGFYRCGQRYYDPENARWLTRDPIGYAGGVNLYGYCGGGPVGWSDANGLQGERVPPSRITGYTGHGLDRAIGSDRPGVSIGAMRDAVRNAVPIYQEGNGTWRFNGPRATVVLNCEGKVVSTWPTSGTAHRGAPIAGPRSSGGGLASMQTMIVGADALFKGGAEFIKWRRRIQEELDSMADWERQGLPTSAPTYIPSTLGYTEILQTL